MKSGSTDNLISLQGFQQSYKFTTFQQCDSGIPGGQGKLHLHLIEKKPPQDYKTEEKKINKSA